MKRKKREYQIHEPSVEKPQKKLRRSIRKTPYTLIPGKLEEVDYKFICTRKKFKFDKLCKKVEIITFLVNIIMQREGSLEEIDLSYNLNWDDDCMEYLTNTKRLIIHHCTQKTITPRVFKHTKNLIELDISHCTQITNQHFEYLQNLQVLKMNHCYQNAITDRAFYNLKSLRSLEMKFCDHEGITRKWMAVMPYLKELITSEDIEDDIYYGSRSLEGSLLPANQTDKPINTLKCIDNPIPVYTLKRGGLVDADYKHICQSKKFKIHKLCTKLEIKIFLFNVTKRKIDCLEEVDFSHNKNVDDECMRYLTRTKRLVMNHCHQKGITPMGFKDMEKMVELDISNCTQISNQYFKYFKNLKSLKMNNCSQGTITDSAFTHLKDLTYLDMEFCDQSGIKGTCLTYMPKLTHLNISSLHNEEFHWDNLKNLKRLTKLIAQELQTDKFNILKILGRSPHLNYLDLTDTIIKTHNITSIKQMGKRSEELLIYCNGSNLFDVFLRNINKLKEKNIKIIF